MNRLLLQHYAPKYDAEAAGNRFCLPATPLEISGGTHTIPKVSNFIFSVYTCIYRCV
jgi:hypothetical protein